MPWEPVRYSRNGWLDPGAAGFRMNGATCTITLHREDVERIGLAAGSRVTVLMGTGADQGYLRVVPDPRGALLQARSSARNTMSFVLGMKTARNLQVAPDALPAQTACVVDQDALVIAMPDWLKPKQLLSPQPKAGRADGR